MGKAAFTAHLGSHEDETSALCDWHLPEAHFLETWGDLVAFDGTPSVQQPLIEPLYEGRSAISVLTPGTGSRQLVSETWRRLSGLDGEDFDRFWKTTLHDGFAQKDALNIPRENPPPPSPPAQPAAPSSGIELVILPDAAVGCGGQSNNAWMQELPRPFTKLVWDNAALVSPALAKRLGLEQRRRRGPQQRSLQGGFRAGLDPAGPGGPHRHRPPRLRPRAPPARSATGVGFDAYPLLGHQGDLTLAPDPAKTPTRQHPASFGDGGTRPDLASNRTKRSPRETSNTGRRKFPRSRSIHAPDKMMNGRYAWAMSIDLSTCIGCNACIIACQAENNIPSVGKDEVARGREMHWIRLDRYYIGESDSPRMVHQPVPCMQCEQAPCEVVCPVDATVHTNDGLNAMVYNRCVGTRYCSNNCPYKVRRFNFFDYRTGGKKSDPRSLQKNPDVTVRGRGVMEKCTYCVQRIQRAVIDANNESRRVRDGEIITACQQACPAEAIVFGDLKTPNSEVAKLRHEPTAYALLGELNTRPRTTYLAKILHPHV